MDRTPSPTATDEVSEAVEARPVNARLWRATWVTFAVVMVVSVVDYLTVLVSDAVPYAV